jgi:RNA polymerase sigma-70 factor (ECF subfamily)
MATALPRDESVLLIALRNGDEDAFMRLVMDWGPGMLRLARAHVPSDAVAEEVVQEAWLGILRGIERFEGRSALRTWAFRIVANTAKTRGVRESRSVPFSAADDDAPAVDPDRFRGPEDRYTGGWHSFPEPFPEQRLTDAETRDVALRAIAALPGRQREVITLRDVEGFSAEETCNALDLTETNQRVLLHRARSRVRSALEEHFDAAGGAS